MSKHPKDALARAVEIRRRRELALLSRERAQHQADLERSRAYDAELDALRDELRELAVRADPALLRWLDQRLELALRATPRRTTRTVRLPDLFVTDDGPRFAHEPGDHRDARARKSLHVELGEEMTFHWRASAPGGGGGDTLPIRPRSFAEIAEPDVPRALGESAEWLERDLLEVAIRIARIVAEGELDELVARALRSRDSR